MHLSTPSRVESNVGEPHHVGSTFGSLPLMGCLPTNLVTHSSGILHTCLPLNCFQTQKVRLTCHQLHHTIHLQKIYFGRWLQLSHVDYLGTHVCTFCELFTPSRVKDDSSVNKMTPNSSGCACIQQQKSIRLAWSPGSRCCTG